MNLQVTFGNGLQVIADNDLDTISPLSAPPQDYGPLSQESAVVVNATVDPPVEQRSPDLMFASSVNHVVPPFQSPVIGHVVERQPTSGSSAKRYSYLCLPIMLGGKEKVKCTWPGCSSILKKDNHTRHVDNIHLRKVKAICTRCKRGFTRTYAKTKHELTPSRRPMLKHELLACELLCIYDWSSSMIRNAVSLVIGVCLPWWGRESQMRSDIILNDSDTRTMVARDLDHLEKLYCTGLKMVPSLEGCWEAAPRSSRHHAPRGKDRPNAKLRKKGLTKEGQKGDKFEVGNSADIASRLSRYYAPQGKDRPNAKRKDLRRRAEKGQFEVGNSADISNKM
ncbi:hypothetical protein BD769DRAFT_1745125 [Suillus cothurnatus]|nr:hypothetical protein BD769DRAFT_1745125 [Suillus cothurnatus]